MITARDMSRLKAEALNSNCIKADHKYIAKCHIDGKTYTGKKYDTIEECNAAQLKLIDRVNDKLGQS